MTSVSQEAEDLADPEYWNARYSQSDGKTPTHEWFKTYSDLQPFLTKHLFEFRNPQIDPKILHLGAGDSTIPTDLLERGYQNQICIDFSSIVVQQMSARTAVAAGIEWLCADVRNMPVVADCSVDVAFDKGTLDAMIYGSPWDPPAEVKQSSSRYMKEVSRVLKDDGVFLYITFRQPHFIQPLINQDGLWEMTVEVLRESENAFEYHAFIMKKIKKKANHG